MLEKSEEYYFVLGAPDPEMETIERILRSSHNRAVHATKGGRRVHPGNAYHCDSVSIESQCVFVECQPEGGHSTNSIALDHHRPGDSGYGRPPAEYWAASSIGQVCTLLAIAPDDHLRMVAAADHCLAAAYRGECPGVEPDRLMQWRAASRAEHQGVSTISILLHVKNAINQIKKAPNITFGGTEVKDLRGPIVPELPEAAAREGVAVLAGPLSTPDGREKIVLQAAGPEVIQAWLDGKGPSDIVDRYGDPARGFAGGYIEVK